MHIAKDKSSPYVFYAFNVYIHRIRHFVITTCQKCKLDDIYLLLQKKKPIPEFSITSLEKNSKSVLIFKYYWQHYPMFEPSAVITGCLRVAWPPPTEVLSACGHTQPRPRRCPGWPAWGRSPARPDLAASVNRPRGPGGRIRRSEAGWGHSGLMLLTAAELLRFRPLANISH